jgi:hypothetical protein
LILDAPSTNGDDGFGTTPRGDVSQTIRCGLGSSEGSHAVAVQQENQRL